MQTIAVEFQRQPVFLEVDLDLRQFFAHHVEVSLQDHGGVILISLGRLFADDDIPGFVLLAPQPAHAGKNRAEVREKFGVFRAVREVADAFEEAEDLFRLQVFEQIHGSSPNCLNPS